MLNKQRIWVAMLWLAAVIIIGCASQEYASANLYIQQEEWAKAKEFFIKAIEVEPENPEIPYKLGYYIYALQEKDWEKMNQSFDKALACLLYTSDRCRRYAVCRSRWSPYH